MNNKKEELNESNVLNLQELDKVSNIQYSFITFIFNIF